MLQGIFDLMLTREGRGGDFLQEGSPGWDKLPNLSGELS